MTAATATGSPALLHLYLAEIGRYPLLSAADERRLGGIIDQGREAQAELDGPGDVSELRERQLRQRAIRKLRRSLKELERRMTDRG